MSKTTAVVLIILVLVISFYVYRYLVFQKAVSALKTQTNREPVPTPEPIKAGEPTPGK